MKLEFLLIFTLYIIIGSFLALLSRMFFTKDLRDYYTSSGRLGAVLSAGTYAATTYSAFMMVGLVGMAYATGVGALGFELLYLAATIFLLSTIGYRIWRLARDRMWIAPSQMIGDLYGSRALGLAVAMIYLFAMIPYLAAQIQGLRAVFSYGGFEEIEAIIIAAILVYAWIVVAGMWSVALTDTYQGFLMLTSGLLYIIWILGYLVPANGISYGELYDILSESGSLGLTGFWSFSVFLAFTIPWAFFAITNPQVVIRLYVPRDEIAYKRGVAYFYIFGFLYTVVVVVVGLVASGLAIKGVIPKGLPWDAVTPHLLGYMHPLLGSLIAVSIIAAAVSTANSIVLAVSGSIITLSRTRSLLVARVIDAMLVTLATLVASLKIGFIVELSVLTSVILIPLAPITILGVYKGGMSSSILRTSALISLIAGVGLATFYALELGPRRAFRETILELPLSAWVLIISTTILLLGYTIEIIRARSTRNSNI